MAVIDEFAATDDRDAAEALLRRQYGAVDIADGSGAFDFLQSIRGDDGISLARFRCGSPSDFAAETGDVVAICTRIRGDQMVVSGGESLDTTRPFLVRPGPVSSSNRAFDNVVVNIHRDRLVADPFDVGDRPEPRFPVSAPASPGRERIWRETVGRASAILGDDRLFRNDLVRVSALEGLRVAAIACFDIGMEAGPVRGLGSGAARRARAHIDEHAAEPLTLADLALAARTSTRSLQTAFRRMYDISPMRYLHRVRLDRCQHDLREGDPTMTSVTAVANRWGFTHLGRFSGDYRTAFGVSPSSDLRR